MESKVVGIKAFELVEKFPKYKQLMEGLSAFSENIEIGQLFSLKTLMNELQQYYVDKADIAYAFNRDSRLPFDEDYQIIIRKIKDIKKDFTDDFYIRNTTGKQEEKHNKDDDDKMEYDNDTDELWQRDVEIDEDEYENDLQLFNYCEFRMTSDEFNKGVGIWKEDETMVSKDFSKQVKRITGGKLKKKQIEQLFYLQYPSAFVIFAVKLAYEIYSDMNEMIRYTNFLCEVMKRKLNN